MIRRLIASIRLDAQLAKRRAIRIAQGKRIKAGISAAQRKAWAKDPLRVSQ